MLGRRTRPPVIATRAIGRLTSHAMPSVSAADSSKSPSRRARPIAAKKDRTATSAETAMMILIASWDSPGSFGGGLPHLGIDDGAQALHPGVAGGMAHRRGRRRARGGDCRRPRVGAGTRVLRPREAV